MCRFAAKILRGNAKKRIGDTLYRDFGNRTGDCDPSHPSFLRHFSNAWSGFSLDFMKDSEEEPLDRNHLQARLPNKLQRFAIPVAGHRFCKLPALAAILGPIDLTVKPAVEEVGIGRTQDHRMKIDGFP